MWERGTSDIRYFQLTCADLHKHPPLHFSHRNIIFSFINILNAYKHTPPFFALFAASHPLLVMQSCTASSPLHAHEHTEGNTRKRCAPLSTVMQSCTASPPLLAHEHTGGNTRKRFAPLSTVIQSCTASSPLLAFTRRKQYAKAYPGMRAITPYLGTYSILLLGQMLTGVLNIGATVFVLK